MLPENHQVVLLSQKNHQVLVFHNTKRNKSSDGSFVVYINLIYILLFWAHYEINNMKGNSAPTTQQYSIFYTNIITKDESDPIQIHFLHVARVHTPVLIYNKIITNGVQKITFMHIQHFFFF